MPAARTLPRSFPVKLLFSPIELIFHGQGKSTFCSGETCEVSVASAPLITENVSTLLIVCLCESLQVVLICKDQLKVVICYFIFICFLGVVEIAIHLPFIHLPCYRKHCGVGSEAVHSCFLNCHNCAVSWLFHLLTVCADAEYRKSCV